MEFCFLAIVILSLGYRFILCSEIEIITCEDDVMTIDCSGIGPILVSYANYGRLDATTCPHPQVGNTDCKASNSMNIVGPNCNDKMTCSIAPSNGLFGDPCGGVYKYLLVRYTCQSQAESTTAETTTELTTTVAETTTTPESTTEATTTPITTIQELTTTELETTTAAVETTNNLITTAVRPTSEITTVSLPTDELTSTELTSVHSTPDATTDDDVMTSSLATPESFCRCQCQTLVNQTDAQYLIQSINRIQKELSINRTELSSFRRTKISVYESRYSAQAIGSVTVLLFTLLLLTIVIPDLIRIYSYITETDWYKQLML